jgi:hypothetical protein
MNHDDDSTENPLAGVDLDAWRVPPAAATDRAAILSRALAPATPAGRFPARTRTLFAVAIAANIALAAALAITLSRSPRTVVVAQPAGAPAGDTQLAELRRSLDAQRAELEHKLAELDQVRRTIDDLTARLAHCEGDKREATTEHPRRPTDASAPPAPPTQPARAGDETCDEVSCVLQDYPSGCCEKYKKRAPLSPAKSQSASPPDTLDRTMISGTVLGARHDVDLCGIKNPVKGMVKIKVHVEPSGKVTNVAVYQTPDASLGAWVAATIQRVQFPATKLGGSFSYPFAF